MGNYSKILLIGLAGSPMALVALGATGPGLAITPSGQGTAWLHDARDILAGRSPGARRHGVVQSKLARAQTPTERVLSGVRDRPVAAPVAAAPALSPKALSNVPLAGPPLAFAPLATDFSDVPIGGVGPIGGIAGPGPLFIPVTAPGGGPGEGGTPSTPVTPPPAVPEPFTWMTLLTGLGLLGWRLRQDRGRATGEYAVGPQG